MFNQLILNMLPIRKLSSFCFLLVFKDERKDGRVNLEKVLLLVISQ